MEAVAPPSPRLPIAETFLRIAAALGESHVRLNVNRMDGPGRWVEA